MNQNYEPPQPHPIPNWVWIVATICLVALTLVAVSYASGDLSDRRDKNREVEAEDRRDNDGECDQIEGNFGPQDSPLDEDC